MSSTRTKGKHDHIYVVKDGITQVGSFTKVENFSEKPDAEIQKTSFIGDDVAEGDIEHDGFDFVFVIHCQDTRPELFWNDIVAKIRAGLRLPQMSLVRITKFLETQTSATVTYEDAVIKLDERNSGSKKDYVKYTFSGFAPRRR